MSQKRRTILVVVGLVGIVALTVVSSKMVGEKKPTYTVDTVKVDPKEFRVTVSAQGTVEPISTVEVRAQVAGRVAEVLVKEGDVVQAGQEIVRLDRSSLLAQLQQAKAAMASAEADLAQLGTSALHGDGKPLEVQQAEAQLAAARARLAETERGPSEAQVAQARAQLTQADTALKDAERNLEATEALYKEGAVAKSVVEEARARLINARAAQDSAKRQYDALLASPTAEQLEMARAQVKEAEIALAMAHEREVSREKSRQAARARLEQARANLVLIETELARTSITAPGNGTIISVLVKSGAVVTDGMPVATLARPGGVRVRARVDETDITAVAVGQRATFTTDALAGTEFSGRVAEIAPAAVTDGTIPRFPVLIDVDGAPSRLLPGMSADVEIATYSKPDALVVPLQAVLEKDGKKVLFVVDQESSTAKEVQVVIGRESLMEAEVLEGISSGDEVVVGDAAVLKKLKDGARVKRSAEKKGEKK
ncbi:MAG: HlyD family secretion protein [Bacillota bacterium]|nr:efflux RND transporter periplasmic adaptor subunit [Bacillota bacterium]MDK2930297.1 HlyD family secretion protein [Bacillota bacterium]